MKHTLPTFTGHKLQGRERFHGLEISIENERGSIRSGTDPSGHEWETFMPHKYGYIRGTVGTDGDHVDVYIGPDRTSEMAYIVHQRDPKTRRYDEDKIMLGFSTEEKARDAFKRQYDRRGFLGPITVVTIQELKRMLKTSKGKKLEKAVPVVPIAILEKASKDKKSGSLMCDEKGKWYYYSKSKGWQPLNEIEGFNPEGNKKLEKAAKRYYSPDEIKARGMRWVTINGAHVLIQGVGDGEGYVVVGGAGGKLNHFKIDRLMSEEEYAERQKRRKKQRNREEVRAITKEDLAEERRKQREQRKARKAIKQAYQQEVSQIVGEDLATLIKESEMAAMQKKAEERAAKRLNRERMAPEGERSKKEEKAVEQEMEKAVKKKKQAVAKSLEYKAMETLANQFSSSDEFGSQKEIDPATRKDIMEALDEEKAKEILKAKRAMKKKLKEVAGAEAEKDYESMKVGEVFAGEMGYTDEEIMAEVKQNIETAKNIEFYDRINPGYDKIKKHIDAGAAGALNGIVSDAYGLGAMFDENVVKELGVEAMARAIASKLQIDGRGQAARDALVDYMDKNREKTVDEAMQRADEAMNNTIAIKELAEDSEAGSAVFSKQVANGYSIRHHLEAQRSLGTAAGSLRAAAHLINALEDPPNEIIQVDLGRDLVSARKRMRRAGLSKDQYKMQKNANGRYVGEVPAAELAPLFEKNHEERQKDKKLDDIKAHRANTGESPAEMGLPLDSKFGWKSPAQEAGFRFVREQKKAILDFEAGIGKTFVAGAAIGHAMANEGKKRILVAVPATLKEQGGEELRKFLLDNYSDKIRTDKQSWSPDKRRSQYELEGIHIVSHDALVNDADALSKYDWDMVVADEVHQMTNAKKNDPGSARYRQLEKFMHKADRGIAMTGTPVKSHKREAHRLVRLMNPAHDLGSEGSFENRHKNIGHGTSAFADSEREAFRQEMARYSYSQNIHLPVTNTKENTKVDLIPEQRDAIRKAQEQYKLEQEKKQKGAASRRDQRMWRITHLTGGRSNPKFKAIVDDIRKNREGQRGLLFFSQGTATMGASRYAKQLNEEFGEGTAVAISSNTPRKKVEQLKRRINERNPDDPLRFLVGTETLATGHNIQGAEFVHHVDVPVSQAQAGQQEARAYRTGQESDVTTKSFYSGDPNDINKRHNLMTKGRESDVMGNPNDAATLDEGGFGVTLRAFEQERTGV